MLRSRTLTALWGLRVKNGIQRHKQELVLEKEEKPLTQQVAWPVQNLKKDNYYFETSIITISRGVSRPEDYETKSEIETHIFFETKTGTSRPRPSFVETEI